MKTESSSQTEETMTLGQRGTYTITFVLHSACVSVCVLNEDTATLCFFFVFDQTSNAHTHRYSFSNWSMSFSGWHMYMQSVSWACAGGTEGKGSAGGRGEGE